jgi:tetratricopeptide (TPR) repeat protein
VLLTAAVIGRSFRLRLLEELESGTPDAALDGLEESERANLVEVEQAGAETRYRFVHELIRQTLAEGLSLPRRQRLHARIADAIERIYGPEVEAHVPALAHHLYKAGSAADAGKTLKYLAAAADIASERAGHEDALVHIDNALSLLEGVCDRRAAEFCRRRAIALRSLSRLPEAFDSYERAIACFTTVAEVKAAAAAGLDLGGIHGWYGDGRRALTVLDRALDALGREPSALRFRLLVFRALVLGTWVDIEAGFSALADAKSLLKEVAGVQQDGYNQLFEARLYWIAAQLGVVGEYARAAIDLFRARGDLWGEADTWEPIGVALYTGRTTEVEDLIRSTMALAERVGHAGSMWIRKKFSAEMQVALGDLKCAERLARESYEFGRSRAPGWNFLDTIVLGNVAKYRGNLDEAVGWFRRGLDLDQPRAYLGMSLGGLFWTLVVQGDPAAADVLAQTTPLLPVPGRTLTQGSCACLAYVIEALAWLRRHEDAAALQCKPNMWWRTGLCARMGSTCFVRQPV